MTTSNKTSSRNASARNTTISDDTAYDFITAADATPHIATARNTTSRRDNSRKHESGKVLTREHRGRLRAAAPIITVPNAAGNNKRIPMDLDQPLPDESNPKPNAQFSAMCVDLGLGSRNLEDMAMEERYWVCVEWRRRFRLSWHDVEPEVKDNEEPVTVESSDAEASDEDFGIEDFSEDEEMAATLLQPPQLDGAADYDEFQEHQQQAEEMEQRLEPELARKHELDQQQHQDEVVAADIQIIEPKGLGLRYMSALERTILAIAGWNMWPVDWVAINIADEENWYTVPLPDDGYWWTIQLPPKDDGHSFTVPLPQSGVRTTLITGMPPRPAPSDEPPHTENSAAAKESTLTEETAAQETTAAEEPTPTEETALEDSALAEESDKIAEPAPPLTQRQVTDYALFDAAFNPAEPVTDFLSELHDPALMAGYAASAERLRLEAERRDREALRVSIRHKLVDLNALMFRIRHEFGATRHMIPDEVYTSPRFYEYEDASEESQQYWKICREVDYMKRWIAERDREQLQRWKQVEKRRVLEEGLGDALQDVTTAERAAQISALEEEMDWVEMEAEEDDDWDRMSRSDAQA